MSQLGIYPSLQRKIGNHGIYRDVKRTVLSNAGRNYDFAEHIMRLEADDVIDEAYKVVLLCVLTKAEQDRVGNNGKGKAPLELNNSRIIDSRCREMGADNVFGSSSSPKEKEDTHYEYFLQQLKDPKQKIGTSIGNTRNPRKRKMTDTVGTTNVAINSKHVPLGRNQDNDTARKKKVYGKNEGSSSRALRPQVQNSNKMCSVQNKNNVLTAKAIAATRHNSCPVLKIEDDCAVYKHNAMEKKHDGDNRKIQNRKLTMQSAHQSVRLETIPKLNVPKKRGRKKLNREEVLVNEAGEGVVENSDKVGKTLVKEERNEETYSDVEILEGVGEGISCPFVPSKEHVGNKQHNEFRRQLLEHLRRPYDKEECKRLRAMVKMGDYFDHHPELHRKLTKYRYRPRKCLTILRGFIFWLQNVARIGAFKPWKDRECLAVEAPSG